MAEGFEPYDHHVPQQSRRDKLRVLNQQGCVDINLLGCAPALVPLYDSPLVSADLINLHHRQGGFDLGAHARVGGKEEGMNLMGFIGGMTNMIIDSASSSSSTNHMFMDPQLSVQLNPSSTVQDINGSPCVFTPHNYKGVLDQSFHGNDQVVVYKPDQQLSAAHDPNGYRAATNGQSLSLSLSSLDSHYNNPHLELNLQRCDSSLINGGYLCAGNDRLTSIQLMPRISPLPLGPFTGYASVLKGSRFLKPAQQLLEEICDVGRGIFADKFEADDDSLNCSDGFDDDSLNCSDGGEQTGNKSRLLSMLDEVYKRYKQYYHQMQAVFTSFESVAGLNGAAPFASLALKAMSKHFKCLKNAITDQLQFANKSHGKVVCERDNKTQRLEHLGREVYGQTPFHSTGFVDQSVWRPQRGLPERAVTVLRAWLFDHFLHPYPTDADKLMLAKQTGLTRNQVSNWFINARVRLWKPMVEEIHSLETRQSHQTVPREERQTASDHLPTSSIECENASSSIHRIGEFSLKRTRNDLNNSPRGSKGSMDVPLNKLLHHPHLDVGLSNIGGCSGVSLTLGLHQNGIGFSESYPINAARRFGLDTHEFNGFAAHNRQFGRDVIEGQVLHDFQESNN